MTEDEFNKLVNNQSNSLLAEMLNQTVNPSIQYFLEQNAELGEMLNQNVNPSIQEFLKQNSESVSSAFSIADFGLKSVKSNISDFLGDYQTLENQLERLGLEQSNLESQLHQQMHSSQQFLKLMGVESELRQHLSLKSLLEQEFETANQIVNSFKSYAESLLNPYHDIWTDFEGRFDKLFIRKIKAVVNWFSQNGWYIDDNDKFYDLFDDIDFEDKNLDKIESYFEERKNSIIEFACELSPKRRDILETAFKAHERGEYVLSIPVLLAQSEGIFFDNFLMGFFYKHYQTKKFLTVKVKECDVTKEIVEPLILKTSLIWSESERRKESFTGLNRHTILHGESINYGTKTNGLKLISFINYICQISNKINNL